MRKLKEKTKKKQEKGITLIALVITIIVLLILAGVTIVAISGDNGILQNAARAKEKTEKETDVETIKLAISEAQIGENGHQNLNLNNLQEALEKQFSKKDVVALDNGDGTFNVNLDDKIYKIDKNEVKEMQIDLYINNEEDLKKFRDEVNSGNDYDRKNIILKNNIAISEEWTPIGLNDNGFKGNFYGNNKSITVSINSKNDGIGVFSENYGNIYSLNILGNIVGNDFVAGVVAKNYGNIVNCSNSATIQSNSTSNNPYIGGVVGVSVKF